LAPFVVAFFALFVAFVVIAAVVARCVVGLGHYWDRNENQASAVHGLQMSIHVMTQAAVHRSAGLLANGQGEALNPAESWIDADARARAALAKQSAHIEDRTLRDLATQVSDLTHHLLAAADVGEAHRLKAQVDEVNARFRARSAEVVRELGLRRVRGS
jgi:hypothetical protein